MKKATFYPMNMLIKGSTDAIKNVIEAEDFPAHEISADSSYDTENLGEIQIAKIVFKFLNECLMDTSNLSFPDPKIKYLIMGDGEKSRRCDGTYAIFKDFGETSPSIIYRFSYSNPHEEEFEAQFDVLEKVYNSFLDNTWEYEYEDYSCGEMTSYAFKGKKAKEIISLWNDNNGKE